MTILGDYLVYDFHRGLLATRRIAALLGRTLSADEERRHARQKLAPVDADATDTGVAARAAGPAVALAVGGVRAERTYDAWPAVARGLVAAGVRRLTLVGSDNGRAAADAVVAALVDTAVDLTDLVGRSDLHGTQRAIGACEALLCADGGLMHLGWTTPADVVALFDASVDPVWRVPADVVPTVLRAGVRDVNAIAAADVVSLAMATLERHRGGHPR